MIEIIGEGCCFFLFFNFVSGDHEEKRNNKIFWVEFNERKRSNTILIKIIKYRNDTFKKKHTHKKKCNIWRKEGELEERRSIQQMNHNQHMLYYLLWFCLSVNTVNEYSIVVAV